MNNAWINKMLINRNCNLKNMYNNQHTEAEGTHMLTCWRRWGEDEERFRFIRNLLAAIPWMEVFKLFSSNLQMVQGARWCRFLFSLNAGNQEEEFDGGIHTCRGKLVAWRCACTFSSSALWFWCTNFSLSPRRCAFNLTFTCLLWLHFQLL